MKKGVVISDTGPVFSLAVINQLHLLNHLFYEVYIPQAVWMELTKDTDSKYYQQIESFFGNKVKNTTGFNELTFIMDYGESESILLYKELNANFLMIDDKKARSIAENLGIQCIGTLGVLSIAKERGLVTELKPLFISLMQNKRYYSIALLNMILQHHQESRLESVFF